jgi:phosphatidylglycerol:prolipoprotein diacylglycerol transferase
MIFLRCYPKITDWLSAVTHLHLGWIPIQSYGFFVACGFLAAAFVITAELRRREALGWLPALSYKDGALEWTSDLVGDFVIICAIFGITGASFFNYLESPASYADVISHPSFSSIIGALFSGLSVFGGMICAGLALLFYGLYKKIKLPHMFDALAYCFILAVGIGRLGCQVSGDGDWGIAHTAPAPSYMPAFLWSNTYAHNIANEGIPIPGCIEQCCHVLAQPVYPTPLYEFLECVAIFFILGLLRKRLTDRPGMLFFVFAILIGIQRYTIEQIRSISDRDLYYVAGHWFRQAELISIALVVAGIAGVATLAWYYKKHPASKPEPLVYEEDEETPEAADMPENEG